MNIIELSSYSAQLPKFTKVVKHAASDLLEFTHLAEETLLRIMSNKNSKHLDVDTCHPKNSWGLKKTLEWFAEVIPGDTNHLEFTLRINEELMIHSYLTILFPIRLKKSFMKIQYKKKLSSHSKWIVTVTIMQILTKNKMTKALKGRLFKCMF